MIADLRGSTALVTGAGGGLGRYIARALAAEGMNLVLSDLPSAPLDDLVTELAAGGASVTAAPFDLTQTDGIAGFAAAVESDAGAIDVLVNNAGMEFGGPFASHTAAEFDAIVRVNLIATMELSRAVLAGMQARDRGHVVNLASLAGKAPLPYLSSYCATKYGIVGLTQALRAEFAGSRVGFSAICPGFISDVGMYGRHEASGLSTPPGLGTMPPEAVGRAVVKAVRKDKPEVIVNRGPVRPLAALSAIAPGGAIWAVTRKPIREFAERFFRATGRM